MNGRYDKSSAAETVSSSIGDEMWAERFATSGRFWLGRRVRPIHKLPTTPRTDTAEQRAALWSWFMERTQSRLDSAALERQ